MPTRASCVPGSSASPPATARSTSSTPTRARASACACAWAAPGASRPCAAPTARDAEAALDARARHRRGAARGAGRRAARARAAGPRRVGEPGRARPVRGPARGEARACCSRRDAGAAHRAGREPDARALLRAPDRDACSPAPRARSASSASPSAAAASRPWRWTGDDSQIRSYPASHGGHVAAGRLRALPPSSSCPAHAPRVASEAVALLRAPACPPGRTTLILAGEQLGLQVHESVGPRGGARPRARARGLLRGHAASCPPTASARCGSAPSS